MHRFLALVMTVALTAPLAARADIAQQSVEIKATPQVVWAAVKNFDGLDKWHPAFKTDVIKSGRNNMKGAVRTLTLAEDGASFDEELLKFDDDRMYFRYRIVGDSPFPITHYVSTLSVKKGKGAMTKVIWQGKFDNKPGSGKTNEEVVEMINGAYRAGLDNLKKLIETGQR